MVCTDGDGDSDPGKVWYGVNSLFLVIHWSFRLRGWLLRLLGTILSEGEPNEQQKTCDDERDGSETHGETSR
jgi:hypothetical protein